MRHFWSQVFAQALGTLLAAAIIYVVGVSAGLVARVNWTLVLAVIAISLAAIPFAIEVASNTLRDIQRGIEAGKAIRESLRSLRTRRR